MKEYIKYSEEQYLNKSDIQRIYEGVAFQCVWEEVKQYRKLFEHKLFGKYYITMNKIMYLSILKLMQCVKCETDYDPVLECTYTQIEHLHTSQRIQRIAQMRGIQIESQLLLYLCSDELFVLKAIMLYVKCRDEDVLYVYCKGENELWLYTLLKEYPYIDDCDTLDMTTLFLTFFEYLYFKLSKKVVSSYRDDYRYDVETLLLRYPQLRKKQVEYYLKYCDKQSYVTIKHYQQYCQVSYESARKQMDDLLLLGFYTKLKVGKRYVFTTSGRINSV